METAVRKKCAIKTKKEAKKLKKSSRTPDTVSANKPIVPQPALAGDYDPAGRLERPYALKVERFISKHNMRIVRLSMSRLSRTKYPYWYLSILFAP